VNFENTWAADLHMAKNARAVAPWQPIASGCIAAAANMEPVAQAMT
jgi:hypothetical protein